MNNTTRNVFIIFFSILTVVNIYFVYIYVNFECETLSIKPVGYMKNNPHEKYFHPTINSKQESEMYKLLELFKSQMEKYNITFSLYGGSLIGVHRHHGIIPWDDDIESEAETWIAWHCNIQGNEFLCEVDEEYIRDKFNLTGLSDVIPHYREAIDIILDEFEDTSDNDVDEGSLEKEASALYGLIHSRYILTSDGIKDMMEKWDVGHFGKCQNIFCKNQKCLPIGLNPNMGNEYVKLYCPSCQNIYNPQRPSNMLDGAYIGPNFPHMLLMMHPELRPKRVTLKVEPKLFGFKIHPLAYSHK